MRKLLLLLILGTLALPAPGQLLRALPSDARRGEVSAQRYAYPLVEISGQVLRLAPGGVIYDENNRTIVHGQLPPYADVIYTFDMNGDVARIYILTPQERARLNDAPR